LQGHHYKSDVLATLEQAISVFSFTKPVVDVFCTQAIQQQSSSETEEGGNTADGSSEGEEGNSVEEEENKEKQKEDKIGSKRKKSATSKVFYDTEDYETMRTSLRIKILVKKVYYIKSEVIFSITAHVCFEI